MFSANRTLNFFIVDSKNHEKLAAREPFDAIYEMEAASRAQFEFEVPKSDKFYFVIENPGEAPVRAFITQKASYGSFSPIFFVAAGLIIAGVVVTLLGILLKPDILPHILDIVRTRRRIRVYELAMGLGTTEALVEKGVYELIRKGHPIRFNAETREVHYG
jgi:hypothetical protein